MLTGDFNEWKMDAPLERGEYGVWSIHLPDSEPTPRDKHLVCLYGILRWPLLTSEQPRSSLATLPVMPVEVKEGLATAKDQYKLLVVKCEERLQRFESMENIPVSFARCRRKGHANSTRQPCQSANHYVQWLYCGSSPGLGGSCKGA